MFSADWCQPATSRQRWQFCHRLYKHQWIHLCLWKCTPLPLNRQLGHISVATGRIPSLFCADSIDIYTNVLKDFPEFPTFIVLSRSFYQMFVVFIKELYCRLYRNENSEIFFYVCSSKQIFSQKLFATTLNGIAVGAQYVD